jgi:hypothetical protein
LKPKENPSATFGKVEVMVKQKMSLIESYRVLKNFQDRKIKYFSSSGYLIQWKLQNSQKPQSSTLKVKLVLRKLSKPRRAGS